MYIAIIDLYGDNNGRKSYYRKDGYCFSFTWDKKFATDLKPEECEAILKHKQWYLDQYKASDMMVEH